MLALPSARHKQQTATACTPICWLRTCCLYVKLHADKAAVHVMAVLQCQNT
jgi:hypothetical protein